MTPRYWPSAATRIAQPLIVERFQVPTGGAVVGVGGGVDVGGGVAVAGGGAAAVGIAVAVALTGVGVAGIPVDAGGTGVGGTRVGVTGTAVETAGAGVSVGSRVAAVEVATGLPAAEVTEARAVVAAEVGDGRGVSSDTCPGDSLPFPFEQPTSASKASATVTEINAAVVNARTRKPARSGLWFIILLSRLQTYDEGATPADAARR